MSIVASIVQDLAKRDPARTEIESEQLRKQLNEQLYWWDEQLQDVLPSISQRAYAGYLAARGLSDIAWICPKVGDTERARLLQPERVDLLDRLLLSLEPAFGSPFTAVALREGLDHWAQTLRAGSPYERQRLERQAEIWRDLLTGARQPESYLTVGGGAFRLHSSFVLQVLRANSGPMALAVVLGGALGALTYAFLVLFAPHWLDFTQSASFKSMSAIVATIAAIAGGFGIGKWATERAQSGIGQAGNILWIEAEQRAINRCLILAPRTRQPAPIFPLPAAPTLPYRVPPLDEGAGFWARLLYRARYGPPPW